MTLLRVSRTRQSAFSLRCMSRFPFANLIVTYEVTKLEILFLRTESLLDFEFFPVFVPETIKEHVPDFSLQCRFSHLVKVQLGLNPTDLFCFFTAKGLNARVWSFFSLLTTYGVEEIPQVKKEDDYGNWDHWTNWDAVTNQLFQSLLMIIKTFFSLAFLAP